MGGPDGNQYESYQNESETATLLNPSPPASPSRQGGHKKGPATAENPQEDVRKHYKYALGTGYMFAMGVCGIVLVALGSTLDDLAENCGTTATDVRRERWQRFLALIPPSQFPISRAIPSFCSVRQDSCIPCPWTKHVALDH